MTVGQIDCQQMIWRPFSLSKTKTKQKKPKNKKKRCMRIYLFHFIEENLCNTYKCTHDSTLKLKRSTWILFFKLTRITCMYIPLNVYGIYTPNNFFRYTETHVVYACIIYERAYKQMPVYRKIHNFLSSYMYTIWSITSKIKNTTFNTHHRKSRISL